MDGSSQMILESSKSPHFSWMQYVLFPLSIWIWYMIYFILTKSFLCGTAKFQGKVLYVVRPVLPSGCEANVGICGVVGAKDSLNLGGYGVELALKNMEYKAIDDSMIKEG